MTSICLATFPFLNTRQPRACKTEWIPTSPMLPVWPSCTSDCTECTPAHGSHVRVAVELCLQQ